MELDRASDRLGRMRVLRRLRPGTADVTASCRSSGAAVTRSGMWCRPVPRATAARATTRSPGGFAAGGWTSRSSSSATSRFARRCSAPRAGPPARRSTRSGSRVRGGTPKSAPRADVNSKAKCRRPLDMTSEQAPDCRTACGDQRDERAARRTCSDPRPAFGRPRRARPRQADDRRAHAGRLAVNSVEVCPDVVGVDRLQEHRFGCRRPVCDGC